MIIMNNINTIIHGDCLEVMKTLPDNSIDLIITDPPYGMEYQSSWRTDKLPAIHNDDNFEWLKPFLAESYRILKEDSHIYLFSNDYCFGLFRYQLEKLFTIKRSLIWVKNNHTSGDLEGDYANKAEFILFAHKGRKKLNGYRHSNVLEFNRVAELQHPTQKPIALLKFLIQKSSNPGDLILDPFCGSGSTCRAAKLAGRNYIGIEIAEEYFKLATKESSETVEQLSFLEAS